jgi:hypothetical protein
MKRNTVILALSTALLWACGAAPQRLDNKISRDALAAEQAAAHKQLVADGDALWDQRSDANALRNALAKWEEAVKLKDDDWQTYAKLTRGAYFLADGYLSFEAEASPEAKKQYLNAHLRGIEHAERGMAAASKDFEKRILAGTKPEDAVVVLGRNAMPLVYWYASNLGKWAKATDFATILKNKERIFKMVSHVYETAPDYFYGAADRYFGAFYSIAPTFAGGDLNKSHEHFQASLKAAPNYLGTYVLAAELYAPKIQDPDVFDQYIQAVLDAPDDAIKGLEPEIAVEKRKAKLLMAKKDELF